MYIVGLKCRSQEEQGSKSDIGMKSGYAHTSASSSCSTSRNHRDIHAKHSVVSHELGNDEISIRQREHIRDNL